MKLKLCRDQLHKALVFLEKVSDGSRTDLKTVAVDIGSLEVAMELVRNVERQINQECENRRISLKDSFFDE